MRTQVTIYVPGKPIPQPRQSIATNGHHFTPDNGIVAYREAIAILGRQKFRKPLEGPIRATFNFWFKRPKSHFTSKGILKETAPEFVPKKYGDGSNLLKGAEDALNKIAWNDDEQIIHGEFSRSWADEDGTEIIIN
jgi:Holliday junction resolvase RusA-like endonuclease